MGILSVGKMSLVLIDIHNSGNSNGSWPELEILPYEEEKVMSIATSFFIAHCLD